MKQIVTFFVLVFLTGQQLLAIDAVTPAYGASGLSFTNRDGASYTGNFSAGAGAMRIVVMKEGNAVTGLPVNGADYTAANSNFATAAAAFTAPGEYVVARTTAASFTVNKLKPGTTYYVAIFEFNGTGVATMYLMTPLTGNEATVSTPGSQANSIGLTARSGNSISFNWTKGSGSSRIIIGHKATPVSVDPQDLTLYTPSDVFGLGTKIGADHYVVYKNNGASVTVKSLEPNTIYHFSVFEYNGISTPVHLVPGAAFSATTLAGPDQAPGSMTFSNVEGNRMRVNVPSGNGTRRLIIARKGLNVSAQPVSGTVYSGTGDFGNLSAEIAPGEFVVGVTTNNFVDVTNLEPSTTYYFRAFEFDVQANGYPYYLTSSFSDASRSTALAPTTLAKDIKVISFSGNSANIGFTAGSGLYRAVIIREGDVVSARPSDLTLYSGGAYKTGSEITPGNWCIVAGTNGNSFNATGLERGKTYHISIFEFNGSTYPVYSATGAPFQFTMPLEPTGISSNPASQNREGASFRFVWNKGTGARRLVIAKKGSGGGVTGRPVDFLTYTANNNFGEGEQIVPGEFVVYDGTDGYFDLKKLESGTSYDLGVFEYNVGADGKPDYLTSAFLSTNLSTLGTPGTQAKITNVTDIQANQATINIDKGTGENRLYVMKKAANVSLHPQDLVKYIASSNFGGGLSYMGDGNYVVAITSGVAPFTVTGLQPNTTYYINGYEFNGNIEPVYLRNIPATASFTTLDDPGATPSLAAHDALVENRDGNKLTLKWTSGDGVKRIVVMKADNPVSFVPAAGTDYVAEAEFSTGTDLGNGQFVVYNGTGSSVEVRNLDAATTYHFRVYEFNGAGISIRYLTAAFLESTATTASAPTTAVTGVQVIPAENSLQISWNNGDGEGRLVVVKEGNAVTGTPMSYTAYPANDKFKFGGQLMVGEFVVYAGAGNSVKVIGLDANKTYHYSIYEYNGVDAPVYNVNGTHGFALTSVSLPVNLVYFKARQVGGDVLLTWATAQESNNESFTIEKSTNGRTFEAIKVIPGALNSERVIEYSYKDEARLTSKTWYRLKQADIDGDFMYSSIVMVEPGAASKGLQVYPNPVKDQIRVEWPGNAKEAVVVVYGANGVVIKRDKLVTGRLLSVGALKPGAYYLVVFVDGQRFNRTIIKN